MKSSSKIIKSADQGWNGVEPKKYKTEGSNFKSISRYSLLDDETSELNSHTRYFEIEPDGYSSLEMHRHPHSVVVLKGSGSVILDDQISEIDTHDVIYIAPEAIHQFQADRGEILGFLCIVDRYRDKPVIPSDDFIHANIKSEKVLKKIRK
ncbi:cupin domain-containing protein [Rhodohalobacter sp.]|uniref:cupin domain-containing protein n=1 Tax=Rhodohalobacter sp. TaxID=1974210 RepID=UPI002ACDC7CB|nr:cupin domain-containing protein [Rhodohalobacter sp.]MDZ7755578.1 cupin domain-containing protein [Rhodohalobacter sp.]